MALSVGSVVAGYTIEAVLGSGGMGTVYKATHPSLPRSDALKVLSAELSRDDDFRARFQREADLAASLDHPNIVTVYDRGETEEGQLWIAMQYVDGSDADDEVREGRMTPQRAVRIVAAVADALDHAHRRKMLHRDVKPANFLLSANDERIFLADFGIARAVDEAVGLTQTGLVMTSVAYAAPETLAGEGVDHRADIYALGCSLFRMLTGKTPFAKPQGGMAATAAAHLAEPPPRATAMVPELPPAIDTVINKVLAKDPAMRYQTAGEFAAAARAALDDTTVRWAAPTMPSAAGGWPAQQPSSQAPQFPTPHALSDVVTHPNNVHFRPAAPTLGGGGPTSAAITPAARSPNRKRRMITTGAILGVVLLVVTIGTVLLLRDPGEPPYETQTFEHAYGTTTLTERPTAVAAIGPGDGAAVLAMGVQPVAIGAGGPQLPSWVRAALTSEPTVLTGFTDTAAVAATEPDVIVATGDLDDATYERLTAIAPTITRPASAETDGWTWQAQLDWVGRILGDEAKADALIGEVRSQQEDLKNQNPAFAGRTIQAVATTDDGIAAVTTPSNTADYLSGLGFSYSLDFRRSPAEPDANRPMTRFEVAALETDVLMIIRTDSKAGQGGFGGLPRELGFYQGISIVVDDPDTIAALQEPGGYLANRYLDATLVPQLSQFVK